MPGPASSVATLASVSGSAVRDIGAVRTREGKLYVFQIKCCTGSIGRCALYITKCLKGKKQKNTKRILFVLGIMSIYILWLFGLGDHTI